MALRFSDSFDSCDSTAIEKEFQWEPLGDSDFFMTGNRPLLDTEDILNNIKCSKCGSLLSWGVDDRGEYNYYNSECCGRSYLVSIHNKNCIISLPKNLSKPK
jgi:hypothetical protein